jgi:hypothetical protein
MEQFRDMTKISQGTNAPNITDAYREAAGDAVGASELHQDTET